MKRHRWLHIHWCRGWFGACVWVAVGLWSMGLLTGCRSAPTDVGARQYVSQFLAASQAAAQLPKAQADSLLRLYLHAPSLAAQGAKPSDYRVNYFVFTDFDVMAAEGELVQAVIWHSEYHWQRNLTFQVARVGREYRLVPGNLSPLSEPPALRYADPWIFAGPIQER